MASGGKAILGGDWSYSLVLTEYDHQEIKGDRRVTKYLGKIIRENTSSESPFNSRITKVSSFFTELGGFFSKLNVFHKIAKHHFIEIETASGHIFTIEKIKDCILQQSCLRPTAGKTPVIRRRRDGEKRPEQQLVVEDPNPRTNKTFLDVLKWIDETDELKEPYHVMDSNCQDFCKNLWIKLSEKGYPNPAKIGRDSPKKASTNIQEGQCFAYDSSMRPTFFFIKNCLNEYSNSTNEPTRL